MPLDDDELRRLMLLNAQASAGVGCLVALILGLLGLVLLIMGCGALIGACGV